MKNSIGVFLSRSLVLSIILFWTTLPLMAQKSALTGAWELKEGDVEHQLLVQDGFFFHTIYSKSNKQFVMSRGGKLEIKEQEIVGTLLFNSEDKEAVGKDMQVSYSINGSELSIKTQGQTATFRRVDHSSAPLAGVWHITSRMQDGKIVPIHRTGARITYKVLTGSRFQWAAINPETKEFSGTGGGSYTFSDGKYTEKIEFFSRDNSRVGASLSFDGKLEDGHWHHSGLSSKGDQIYEIWSKVVQGK